MALGFVLLELEPGHENSVFKQLMEVPEVAELHPLFGDFDLLAKVRASSVDALARVIVDRVRGVPGVRRSETLTVTSLGREQV